MARIGISGWFVRRTQIVIKISSKDFLGWYFDLNGSEVSMGLDPSYTREILGRADAEEGRPWVNLSEGCQNPTGGETPHQIDEDKTTTTTLAGCIAGHTEHASAVVEGTRS